MFEGLRRAIEEDDNDCLWPARITAAQAILDRGWGKPKEVVENQGMPSFVQLIKKIINLPAPPPSTATE
jgi:hypothetical protein